MPVHKEELDTRFMKDYLVQVSCGWLTGEHNALEC